MNLAPDLMARYRFRLWGGSLLVCLACALILLTTSSGLPMAWDEGNAILRAEKIARWTERRNVAEEADRTGRWGDRAIAEGWPYTTQIEGHPAFYGILIASGRSVSGGWLAPLESARFGPIVLFAVAAGAMFYRLRRENSLAAALGAVAALVLLPRMFAHAHFASFDGPLTSCWILAWATFSPALVDRRWAIAWGVALGMTLSTKATGWFAPVPFLAWALLYRDRAAIPPLAIGTAVALAVFVMLNPPLWHHPIDGMARFVDLNLHRAQHGWNISVLFLGRMYNLDYPLPWYNSLLWTAIAVPTGILALAIVGIIDSVRRWKAERLAILTLLNWLVLIVVRALPFAPPHDGIRQFLPAFAFLAVLAGMGTSRIFVATAKLGASGARMGRAAVVLVYLGSASSLFWYAPQWLSYYNLLIGGLPGADAVGMEPTYYWDALDRSTLAWLHRNTEAGDKIRFGAGSTDNLLLMRRWGLLTRGYRQADPGTFRWYVLQRRPSAWQRADRWLLDHAQPAFQKRIRQNGFGPWRLDVPLVEVYPYDQYRRALRETKTGLSSQGHP